VTRLLGVVKLTPSLLLMLRLRVSGTYLHSVLHAHELLAVSVCAIVRCVEGRLVNCFLHWLKFGILFFKIQYIGTNISVFMVCSWMYLPILMAQVCSLTEYLTK
jgi:hypothetical protein